MVKKDIAETYHVAVPSHSYGIFCINTIGDLFLSSDWGMYGYAWRSYGKDFKDFIAYADPHYIFQKFVNNMTYTFGKTLPRRKSIEPHVIELIKAFQTELKLELADQKLRDDAAQYLINKIKP